METGKHATETGVRRRSPDVASPAEAPERHGRADSPDTPDTLEARDAEKKHDHGPAAPARRLEAAPARSHRSLARKSNGRRANGSAEMIDAPPAPVGRIGGTNDFTDTNWSLVRELQCDDADRREVAMERLVKSYQGPVYAFLSRP